MSSDRIRRPPRLATAILSLTTGRPDRASVLGDLTEEFRAIALDRGWDAASRWYWSQAVRSVGPLLWGRLASEGVTRSVGGTSAGLVAAVVAATVFGLVLDRTWGPDAEATLAVISAVVMTCALLSSTVASLVSGWASGRLYRWTLVVIGLVVVAPDITYAARHYSTHGLPSVLLPPSLAILATCAGLALGVSACRVGRLHS